MLRRECIVAKLREMGFRFKEDGWRVSLYKRGTERVEVPKKDFVDEDWARSVLRRLKVPPDEIEQFITHQRC